MTSRNSLSGLREGVIFTSYWSSEAKSRSAPIRLGHCYPGGPSQSPASLVRNRTDELKAQLGLVLGLLPLLLRRLLQRSSLWGRILQRSPLWRMLLSLVPLTPTHLLRWRWVKREMARLGPNRLRQVRRQNSNGPGP